MMAAVLAGGKSRRFGEDKLLYLLQGKPLILYSIERLLSSSTIEDVVIVGGVNTEKYEKLGFRVIADELGVGPAGGVLTALRELGDAFIAGGDMPLINPKFVDLIVTRFYENNCTVCTPLWSNGYIEPLHAAYSRNFTSVLERRIKKGEYSLNGAIKEVNFCGIDIEKLPENFRESFFNINRKSDLKKLFE